MGSNRLNKKALSLVEIIISCLLIGILVQGFTATFLALTRWVMLGSRNLQATHFAEEVIEQLEVKDYNDPALNPGPHVQDSEGFLPLPPCPLRDLFGATRSYTVEAVTEGKKITVNVNWTDDREEARQETIYGLVIQP